MKKRLTKIICVIDNSGSMAMIKKEAIGGFNEFIKSQRKIKGKAEVSVYLFNSTVKQIIDDEDINEVPLLTPSNYKCRGMTALNDALGRAIMDTSGSLLCKKKKSRPCRVIFCILTDGEENHSKEYSTKEIKRLIKRYKKLFNWKFVFLAANQDAFVTAKKYAFDRDCTFDFDYSPKGVLNAYSAMNTCTSFLRGVPKQS